MSPRIAILIPLYNHGATIRTVVERSLAVLSDVWIVDDGSNDSGIATIQDLPIHILSHKENCGKGTALRTGAKALYDAGYTHMITLDADDQHYPEDASLFIKIIYKNPHSFIVGARDFTVDNVPKSSRFGRSFSAFWMFVQTGQRVSDMQSGYRAYPLHAMQCLSLHESRYSFEIEVLVAASWAGFAIIEIPIRVQYQKGTERISHFKAIQDNVRISLLNTRLTIRALTPIPFRRHALDTEGKISLLSPLASLKLLLQQSSPWHLSYSTGIAYFICALPLLGLQSILLLYAINTMRLNRLCALVVIPLSWPPVLPAISILLGHRLWHGLWLSEFSIKTLGYEAGQRFLEWILGSIVLAPFMGMALGAVVWFISLFLGKK